MEIKGTMKDGIIYVTINGRLDMANALTAEQHFLKYAEHGNQFVLDFSGVEFITSAGIRALLTLYRTVAETEGSVTIRKPQAQVLEVLEETEFAELFNIE